MISYNDIDILFLNMNMAKYLPFIWMTLQELRDFNNLLTSALTMSLSLTMSQAYRFAHCASESHRKASLMQSQVFVPAKGSDRHRDVLTFSNVAIITAMYSFILISLILLSYPYSL